MKSAKKCVYILLSLVLCSVNGTRNDVNTLSHSHTNIHTQHFIRLSFHRKLKNHLVLTELTC